jgi:hypothetical protein
MRPLLREVALLSGLLRRRQLELRLDQGKQWVFQEGAAGEQA